MAHQNSKGAKAFVYPYGPEITIKDPIAHHNKPEEHPDTLPSEYQPPGTDSEEYSSLEEALTS